MRCRCANCASAASAKTICSPATWRTMFTGIIEALGTVRSVEATAAGARLVIEAGSLARETAVGDSVAVNGVCLTAVKAGGGTLSFDAIPETLRRSNLGNLQPGDAVN